MPIAYNWGEKQNAGAVGLEFMVQPVHLQGRSGLCLA